MRAPPDLDQIEQLKTELAWTRRHLIDLAAKSVPNGEMLFHGYYFCKTREQFRQWERDVMAAIIAAAVPDPESRRERRAYCPLCKEGTESWSAGHQGFTTPEGLERHLNGSMRAHQCSVMEALSIIANEHAEPMFAEDDQRKADAEKSRRKTERTFVINEGPPQLLDEHIWRSRNKEQLFWAEQRLNVLGFETIVNGNTVAYQRQHGEFTILADPRETNHIRFQIFRRAPSGKFKPVTRQYRTASFALPDAWKNELPFKFKKMADEACA
jgi:hypothetical protein